MTDSNHLTYPDAPSGQQMDDYHGTQVTDPYRWLENPDSAETQAWIEAQNQLTFAFLEQIPEREAIKKRLAEIWNFPKFFSPVERQGRYFQLRNSGLQNQHVLYELNSPTDEGEILLDPNTLSEDGTDALVAWSVSKDGHWLAYAITSSGSDWLTWHIRDVESGKDLPDTLEWGKFSEAEWLPDGSGFYYSCYDEPDESQTYTGINYYHKVYFHRRGTPQSEDELIYERRDEKEWLFFPEVSHDGRYLFIYVSEGAASENLLFYKDLQSESGQVVELINTFKARYGYIHNEGTVFYLQTDWNAPHGQLITVDITKPDSDSWQTHIPEGDETLEIMAFIGQQFVGQYMKDACHLMKRFDKKGSLQGEIPLPALGSVMELQGKPDDEELFFLFTSFVYPSSVYRYDFKQDEVKPLNIPELDFDNLAFSTEQVFVKSKDGTRVPMFVTARKDIKRDGSNPTILYGYGGFNIPLTPFMRVIYLAWLDMGGIFVSTNLRGGSEYGENWHRAGMLHKKQNVFDDFIACAEYLIDEKYTSREKLAISGGSNGGLLVGACMVQRPDLFGAVLPSRGVLDMLRFHQFTIGRAWVSEYGCADNAEQFKTLYAYSPLHNIKPVTPYPPTLVTTADHDDRVVPGHSFKFTAALQAAQTGDAPILIRIQTRAGHGMGTPTAILIAESADVLAFLVRVLKMAVNF